jgi:heme exporter protein D
MTWGSWDNFLAMGGYAFYVWGSYLVALALMIAEIALLALRKRSALARLRARNPAQEGSR